MPFSNQPVYALKLHPLANIYLLPVGRQLLPGFEEQTEVLLTSTFHGQWPAMHAWPGDDMPQKTPIVNLYNVGDGVKTTGMIALPAVAETAQRVVEDIKKRFPEAK